MTAPTALSAAELLELAQQKLREEAEQKAAAGVPQVYTGHQALPSQQDMQVASSVLDVVHTAGEVERLKGTDWKLTDWSTPHKWIQWQSQINAKCELCGEGIAVGEACRWLMKSRAPHKRGLSMHPKCWEVAQQAIGLD